MPVTDETRGTLLGAKLKGVVRARLGEAPDGTPTPLGGSAALRTDAGGFVLAHNDPDRALGAALAWRARAGRGPGPLTVVVDVDPDGRPRPDTASVLARRAAGLAEPPIIWWVDGSQVRDTEPAPVETGPFVPPPPCEPFAAMAAHAGLDVVPHRAGITIEVLGLEIGRAMVEADGTARLRVGVGRHDRDATDDIFDAQPTLEILVRAAEVIRTFRRPGEVPGPANLLARERWVRDAVRTHGPELGLPPLDCLPEAEPAGDLRRPRPAAATGDGLVVVCSAGVDLDLVPAAADAWLTAGRPPRVILVLPTGSEQPITWELAQLLAVPAEVVVVGAPWDGPVA